MKLVFCGTPFFAVPTLKQLLRAGHSVEIVVTQPDRPIGRAREVTEPAVKVAAKEAGLAVVQPAKIKTNPEFRSRLEAIRPDAVIVVAYGRIIPKWMLDLAPLGNLNLHASLLPKYRGAAPIQWAIANGEATTGTTTMRIDEGLDTGADPAAAGARDRSGSDRGGSFPLACRIRRQSDGRHAGRFGCWRRPSDPADSTG